MNKQVENIKVLVVDDNSKNILAMKKILSDIVEIDIHTALSGEEALKLTLRNDYAVVYLDIQMPGMNGYEVAECLAKNKSTKNMPVVFVTAIYNDRENILKGYQTGAIDYLTKPIHPDILIAKTKIFVNLYNHKFQLEDLVNQLDEVAHTDILTGIANRRQLNETLNVLLALHKRTQRKLAYLIIDLDNFKSINDHYGHSVGDKLLKTISEKISKKLRESDVFARIGGDEFVAVLTETNQAEILANKLIKLIAEPIIIDNCELTITGCIGVGEYPRFGQTADELYKVADKALIKAKQSGKNRVVTYTDDLDAKYKRLVELESSLINAVANKEIKLVYQPKYNIIKNEIIGFEVLSRWQHKTLGFISPIEFIGIAEQTGFISELGEYILRQAFSQFEIWQKEFPNKNFNLAINLSPYQLLRRKFLQHLNKIIADYDISLDRLEFELTESLFTGDQADLAALLNSIKDMGIQMSIDDFGTEYSSLSRLQKLPISVLKIDKSFMDETPQNKDASEIVIAIISLANALRMKVIAEGIETKEQVEFLKDHDCYLVQGYYYSKPVNADEATHLITEN